MKKYIVILLAILANFQIQGQDKLRIEKKIQYFIDSCQEKKLFPGLTATVVFPDGTVSSFATGYADTLVKSKLKVTDKLLGGSTGKMYFSILTLMAVQEGKLDLDDKVEKYLVKKEWFSRVPNSKEITLRHLLNHSAGIEEYYVVENFLIDLKKDPDRVWKPEELIGYVFDRKPLFPPGSNFSYADTDYLLVGLVLEEALGIKCYDEIQRKIITPMELKSTVPSVSRNITGLVNGYSAPYLPFKGNGAVMKDGRMSMNIQFEWAGGGFATNSTDLAKLVRGLFDKKLISEKMLTEMTSGIVARELGEGQAYGLGLIISPTRLGTCYGHSGWFPGYMSDVSHFPDHNITIAVQLNSDDVRVTHGPTGYLRKIAKIVVMD